MVTPTNTETDNEVYALYEHVLREVRNASTIRADLVDSRPDGSTYGFEATLRDGDFLRIPWGRQDAIREAYWYPHPEYSDACSHVVASLPEYIYVRVFVDSWRYGIGIEANILGDIFTAVIGVEGTVREMGIAMTACRSADQVVQEVQRIIERAYEAYAEDMGQHGVEYDAEYPINPLDERSLSADPS